jgi:hypothetical protein
VKLIDITDPSGFTDDEICARCEDPGKLHRPPKSYGYAKTGSSSGNAHEVKILARTCNWGGNPLTTCIAFARKVED